MKFIFFLITSFCCLVISLSCATLPEEKSHREESVVSENVEEKNLAESRKTDVFDAVKLRDVFTGNISALSELAGNRIVLADFSASYCNPCHKLTERLNKLHARYAEDVFFLMIIPQSDAAPSGETKPDYPVYTVVENPSDQPWKHVSVYPTVLVFDDSRQLSAEIEGLYPLLYYFQLIEDLLPGRNENKSSSGS